ncbi:ABC transporter ATP-binding protein [Pseudomonas sp. PICF141]|uniref:ABC transporter ATP-binding protein n=1 Tax=Pseudomonas sp. PICF141 TaxID=1949067 RepID=UPI000BAB66C7|nr:ABC transporter ATP-binding protein [Pseudomonas sp. PICF141]PAU51672.1 ABC transporter ATP-binding protein [Pseudomonas sp. PICF141]
MSSELAIKVEGIHKCFHIYEEPRDRFKQFIFPLTQSLLRLERKNYYREFWALQDVSFEIRKGEIVGIIGRNGAGKSTLLQIICGTLNSTSGNTQVNGRVAALLELGAGFNPEFSGRENIYLNGSILGLTNAEIDARYEEIIDFADIGSFIEQPVKTYSSGMFVRLAFAVQACIEPDILIVDEALAVGDIGFQYKCFKRIEKLRDRGTTILMVTHSTGSILEYANRCLVIDNGRVITDTEDVLSAVLTYEKGMVASQAKSTSSSTPHAPSGSYSLEQLKHFQASELNTETGEKRFGSARAIIKNLDVFRMDGTNVSERPIIKSGEELRFSFVIASSEEIEDVALGISLSKALGGDIWGDNNLSAGTAIKLSKGQCRIEYTVRLPLSASEYLVHCGLSCTHLGKREELDQRRPMQRLRFWTPREQVGVIYSPITVTVVDA